jgi:hypothetical protein
VTEIAVRFMAEPPLRLRDWLRYCLETVSLGARVKGGLANRPSSPSAAVSFVKDALLARQVCDVHARAADHRAFDDYGLLALTCQGSAGDTEANHHDLKVVSGDDDASCEGRRAT